MSYCVGEIGFHKVVTSDGKREEITSLVLWKNEFNNKKKLFLLFINLITEVEFCSC